MKYNADSFNGGLTLKAVRERAGMDREKFASELGISKRSLESYEDKNTTEKGEPRRIYIDSYMRMCDHFGCDIDYLLGVQDLPIRNDTNINAVTGLSQNCIRHLKNDHDSEEAKEGIISGVDSVKIVNSLFDTPEGDRMMLSIQMYLVTNSILKLHRKGVDDLVRNINEKYDQHYEADNVLNGMARKVLKDAKQSTAMNGLHLFGRNQNKIESVKNCFIRKFESEHFDRQSAVIVYNYLEAEDRLKVLQHDCYDNLVQLLDALTPNTLEYNGSLKGMAELFGFSDMTLKPPKSED